MAGYHCLMPTAFLPLQHDTRLNTYGISTVATQHKIIHLRHFIRCNTTQNHTPTAFSFIKNKTRSAEFPNLTIWNLIFGMHNYKCCLTAFHPLNTNPFIHYDHGGLLLLFLRTILDLIHSALKVHQNTGRGEVKRNPCLEFTNR